MAQTHELRWLGLAVAVVALIVGAYSAPSGAQAPAKKTIDFNRDVRPILAQHCWVCHGSDPEALKKTRNMSLDSFEGATQDRGGYRAITPGKPDQSALLRRVTAEIPAMQMPPPDSGLKRLTKDEVGILRKWIEEGAEYSRHWAFVPPKLPALPTVRNAKWVRNDIDRFVLAKLEEQNIAPEPEADRATLIRRASLTLTGLPPTPAEIDAFLADGRPNAYERLVDRLLASPRYGENQARYWLDAVRYADTHGLHIDNERGIYPYRDWVVRAYNEDLPYDQFTLWQLAGDLLPHRTTDQLIATGYVRLNPTTNEGGAIEAEFLAKNTMDRVDTTATVFMGVTLGCAKCHDHKYDPFTQRDYYSMYAFFDSTADAPLDGNLRYPDASMPAPSPAQAARMAAIESAMSSLLAKANTAAARRWALSNSAVLPEVGDWQVAGPYMAKDFATAFNQAFPPEPGGSGQSDWKPLKFELDALEPNIVGQPNAAAYLRATVTVSAPLRIDLRLGSDDGIKVWLNGVAIHQNMVERSLAADEDKVEVNLNPGRNDLLVKIVNSSGQDGAYIGFGNHLTKRLARARAIALQKAGKQTELAALYLELGPDSADAARYRGLIIDKAILDAAIPRTLIAKELPKPRETHILRRGQYDLPTDLVSRAIPKVFGALPAGAPHDRLGLARWIIDPSNPLTARVYVNRIWQQHFGTGLVKSSEDFGSRGDWPSHPELLDYLACKFVQGGWSLKKLQRLILTSATFRQAATCTVAKRAKDPDNILLSRGPRFRLDAEVIRDTALYASGLLVENPGGHGDKPYQPPGLWSIIAYPISDTAHYRQDHGDSLYRRSLYLFWKRTSPPPTMLLFDAPMRESCVVRRSRTNTPTQALATLNETGFFEAARNMAQRVIKTKPGEKDRIDYAFRLATGRDPNKNEMSVVESFLSTEKKEFEAAPENAEKTLKVGESLRDKSTPAPEHAAWTMVCNLILNLDETLTQH